VSEIIEIKVHPDFAFDASRHLDLLSSAVGVKLKPDQIRMLKRSIDARQKPVSYILKFEVSKDAEIQIFPNRIIDDFTNVSMGKPVHIIGAGPAGYFAALELISLGLKPIIYDRGKEVRARRRDLKAIQQDGIVNPDSNYCFGEGGAGTYSDGKLYTRSNKRGDLQRVLKLLVEHHATPDILVDAHPHIGSNKLPQVVEEIRNTIVAHGGEIHFDSKLTDIHYDQSGIRSIEINGDTNISCQKLILATGHSARDIYELLWRRKVHIESKAFALGVRIEHPQSLIDSNQYRQSPRHLNLPAASYSLVTQVDGRGVFSFCMCPGGLIVPAATAPGEIVVNGMSMSRRDSPYANSGIVVAVEKEDLKKFDHFGPLATMKFQASVEQNLFNHGDGSQKAPSMRLTDFVNGKMSNSLGSSSYIPGLFAGRLDQWLPPMIYQRLKSGVMDFGRKMKGYYTEEAMVVGTESRTSSPVKIPRDSLTGQHVQINGLFPCGEGAGYAGGIVSAALDGQFIAKKVLESFS